MKRMFVPVVLGVMAVVLWLGARSGQQSDAEAAGVASPEAAAPVSATTPAPRPAMPRLSQFVGSEAEIVEAELVEDARALANAQTPGAAAFRITTDAYVDYNLAEAKAKAEMEGLTVDEVRELTYFGHMVLRSQHWNDVEELLGLELADEHKDNARSLMMSANADFKLRMRELVANGGTEAERWELIRATEENYLYEYFAITGVHAPILDQLLGGDFGGRTGAPAQMSEEEIDDLLARANANRNPNPEGIDPQDDGE